MTNEEILKKHIPEHQIWGNGITGKSFLQYTPLENVLSALEEAREDERNKGRGEAGKPVIEWVPCRFCNGVGTMPDKSTTSGLRNCGVCLGSKMMPKLIKVMEGRGEGPVWVKAESELPKPFVNVSFRIASVNYLSAGFYDDKAKKFYCNCLKQLIDNGFKEIEWLKEPDKLEQSNKEQ